jgi:hypothetical protein
MHQGVPRVESGAYTIARKHFKPRDNAACPPSRAAQARRAGHWRLARQSTLAGKMHFEIASI